MSDIPSQPIGLPYASFMIMKFDVDLIIKFRDHVIEAYDSKMNDLISWFNLQKPIDYDDIDFYYSVELSVSEEGETLDSVKTLTHELCLVALYRRIEINTSKLLNHLYTADTIRNDNLYIMPNLIGRLRRDHRLELRTLPHFAVADECRAINNSIKHGNKVNADLFNSFNVNGWVLGRDMSEYDLNAHFERLNPGVPLYFQELATEVERVKS